MKKPSFFAKRSARGVIMVRGDTLPPPLAIYIPQSNESHKKVVLHIVLRIKLYKKQPSGRSCSSRVNAILDVHSQ